MDGKNCQYLFHPLDDVRVVPHERARALQNDEEVSERECAGSLLRHLLIQQLGVCESAEGAEFDVQRISIHQAQQLG